MSHRGLTYKSFIKVADDEGSSKFIEISKEIDGKVLLSKVKHAFPAATGLTYKGAGGGWRPVQKQGDILYAPKGVWGNYVYYVSLPKSGKRTISHSPSEEHGGKSAKLDEESNLSEAGVLKDLVVLSLPLDCNDDDLKEHFTKECGVLAYCEVKCDYETKKPKGFGFVRFKRVEDMKKALNREHYIKGRVVQVRLSKKNAPAGTSVRLFIGRIPDGTTKEELGAFFSKFGNVINTHIPFRPFRGFGFVTFETAEEGRIALHGDHKFKDTLLNVVIAAPPPDYSQGQTNEGDSNKFDSRPMDSRDNRNPIDSRGPRDFRDPVERNQMEKSTGERFLDGMDTRDRVRGFPNMTDGMNLRDGGDLGGTRSMGFVAGTRDRVVMDSRGMGDIGGIRDRDVMDGRGMGDMGGVRDRDVGNCRYMGDIGPLRESNLVDSRGMGVIGGNRDVDVRDDRGMGDIGGIRGRDVMDSRFVGDIGGFRDRDVMANRGMGDIGGIRDIDVRDGRGMGDIGGIKGRDVMDSRGMGDIGGIRDRDVMERIPQYNEFQERNSREISGEAIRDQREINRNHGDVSNYQIGNHQQGNYQEGNYQQGNHQQGNSRETVNYNEPMVSRDLSNQQQIDPRGIKGLVGSMISRDLNPQSQGHPVETNYMGSRDSRDVNDQQRGDPREINDYRGSRDRNSPQRGDARETTNYRGSMDSRDIKDSRGSRDSRDRDNQQRRDSRDRDNQQRRDSRDIKDYRGSRDSKDRNTQQHRDSRDIKDNRRSRDSKDHISQQHRDSRDIKDKGSRDTRDRNTQERGDSRDTKDHRRSRDTRDNNNRQRGDSRERRDNRESNVSRERNDRRTSRGNQSRYDPQHDLLPQPGSKDFTAELQNMVYQFLGSLK